MNKLLPVSLVGIAVALAWFASADFIVAGLVLFGYGTYFLLAFPRRLATFNQRRNQEAEAFQFVNAFVIALSVKNTPGAALESIQGQLSANLKREIEQADTIDTQAVLEYLKTYFPLPLYDMFVTLIELHTAQGGSILEMAELLLATGRRHETDCEEKRLIARRRMTNFVILWILTVLVLLFSRFGISSLFDRMKETVLFKIGIAMYFAFMLYSVNAWVSRFMQGDSHD
ncbi:MAG: hypothetical protein WC399_01920 [Bacilli bacterium]|jgi:uncharacterized membrane protein YkvI